MNAVIFRREYPSGLPVSMYPQYDLYLANPEKFKNQSPVIYKILMSYIKDGLDEETENTEE